MMFLFLMAFLLMTPITVNAECLDDCSKVLIASAKPMVREQHTVVEKKDPEVTVKTCVEWNGECQPVDERSGFYSVVTSQD